MCKKNKPNLPKIRNTYKIPTTKTNKQTVTPRDYSQFLEVFLIKYLNGEYSTVTGKHIRRFTITAIFLAINLSRV